MARIICVLRGNPISRPFVATWLNIPGGISKPILFLIDTGSEVSFLSPTDAISMGIILDKLPNPGGCRQIKGVGGLIPNHRLGEISNYDAKFISTDGWFHVPGGKLLVLKQEHGYRLPSVWGMDFLLENGLKFCFKQNNSDLYTD